jgi:hypothetical protein
MSARKRASNVNRTEITRRSVLGAALAGAVAAGIGAADQGAAASPVPPFDLEEATVTDLQAAMAARRLTSKAITAKYLERMTPLTNAVPRCGTSSRRTRSREDHRATRRRA